MQIQYSELIAKAVEAELNRLRAARPSLALRIDRAGNILVTHLSCRRRRVIRVRVGADGKQHYLVNGSGGNVYSVNADFSCSCPDAHRRGKGCKHSIAVWALSKACWRGKTARPKTTRHDRDSFQGITVDPERLNKIAARLGV